jgi:hypothetical protein
VQVSFRACWESGAEDACTVRALLDSLTHLPFCLSTMPGLLVPRGVLVRWTVLSCAPLSVLCDCSASSFFLFKPSNLPTSKRLAFCSHAALLLVLDSVSLLRAKPPFATGLYDEIYSFCWLLEQERVINWIFSLVFLRFGLCLVGAIR